MKKSIKKEIQERMLGNLNDFMKNYGIDSINFGKTHSIERTEGKLAKDVVRKRGKK